MIADEMPDIVQQRGHHQAFGCVVGGGAGGALFHVLRHANRLAHVFLGTAVSEQIEDGLDNPVAIVVSRGQF
jgi:hypothetical protein